MWCLWKAGAITWQRPLAQNSSIVTIYVIDVAGGDKIPRKGGPGITKSDLLVINKTDLAPYVGASLEVMDRDSKTMRGDRSFVFTNLKAQDGIEAMVKFLLTHLHVA